MKGLSMLRGAARRAALLALCLALAALYGATAHAGGATVEYPAREVRVVVPFEPGGGMDATARLLAQQLSQRFQQAFVVLNRSGADGSIGTASVARAAADGQTLLFSGLSHLTLPLLRADTGYDSLLDFEPIARIASAPNVLLVNAALKDLTLAQLLRATGKDGASLSFGSSGHGTTSHLAADVFMSHTGVHWLHVPYRGSGPALRALMAGEVQIMFAPASSVAGALQGGRVHALALAHGTRLALYPELPTLRELGVKGAEFTQWYGLFAPAGTSVAVLDALAAASAAAVQTGALAKYIADQGMQASALSRAEFARSLQQERQRLTPVLNRLRAGSASP